MAYWFMTFRAEHPTKCNRERLWKRAYRCQTIIRYLTGKLIERGEKRISPLRGVKSPVLPLGSGSCWEHLIILALENTP
jgi:hypothetical protein